MSSTVRRVNNKNTKSSKRKHKYQVHTVSTDSRFLVHITLSLPFVRLIYKEMYVKLMLYATCVSTFGTISVSQESGSLILVSSLSDSDCITDIYQFYVTLKLRSVYKVSPAYHWYPDMYGWIIRLFQFCQCRKKTSYIAH